MWISSHLLSSLRRNNCSIFPPICMFGLLMFLPLTVKGQAKVGSVLFPGLLYSNTAASNGMGATSITDVDENSALHNPGALGVFHLDHYLAASLPNSTKLFGGFSDEILLKTSGVSVGYSFKIATNSLPRPILLSASAAYSRKRFELGKLISSSVTGAVIDTVEPFDETKNYTLSVGLDFFARLGIGVRFTNYEQAFFNVSLGPAGVSFLEIDATAASIGVYGELTLRLDNQGIGIGRRVVSGWSLNATSAIGLVRSITSDELVANSNGSTGATPTFENSGASILTEITNRTANLFSVRYATETTENLQFVNSFADSRADHHGIEVGLVGTFYYRDGRLDDPVPFLSIETDGYGFRLRGILAWLDALDQLPAESTKIGWLLWRIDIRYDHASYNRDPELVSPIDFAQVAFSL